MSRCRRYGASDVRALRDLLLCAGYIIYYYDLNENLVPKFEEEMIEKISLLLITGYFRVSGKE